MVLADLTAAFHPTGTAMNITLTDEEIFAASAITALRNRQWMVFDSSFIVYMIALLSFVGWFLFAVSLLLAVCQSSERAPLLLLPLHSS